jgi:hypothetical protein
VFFCVTSCHTTQKQRDISRKYIKKLSSPRNSPLLKSLLSYRSRLRLKCDGTRAETIFRLSAKRTNPFKSAGALIQSTTGSRDVRISGSNAAYTTFRVNVKDTGYPLHSPISPSLPLTCVTVCHHISTVLYVLFYAKGQTRNCILKLCL